MSSLNGDEESQSFDAKDDISSLSDTSCDDNGMFDRNSCSCELVGSSSFDLWREAPRSVKERRSEFIDWWLSDRGFAAELGGFGEGDALEGRLEGGRGSSGCLLRSSSNEFDHSNLYSVGNIVPKEDFVSQDTGFEDDSVFKYAGSKEFTEDNRGDSEEGEACEVCLQASEVSKNTSESSIFSQHLVQKDVKENILVNSMKRVEKSWLSKLRSIKCNVRWKREASNYNQRGANMSPEANSNLRSKIKSVKVHKFGKGMKELSAMHMEQNIQAHKGSILAMKFSPDGHYLATGGEDAVVRVWQVIEEERANVLDIIDVDLSTIYFKENNLSELIPLEMGKERLLKPKSWKKTTDSSCIIFPRKIIRIMEKPLHELCGHIGEILDLSWSNNNLLLSSSEDETVRLWKVGSEHCLKVFLHSNYVTCVQFNPIDDNYFISGSIDGNVRIWSIPHCQVVDWASVNELITAICYRPDGQGGIVGSLTGNCRFFYMPDNHLQLDAQICLASKKKELCKKIYGFEFFPEDTSKVIVSCADSCVTILQGINIIGKYKGVQNAGIYGSASLTADGKHIISAGDDSNVYIWNSIGLEEPSFSHVKQIRSCEQFSTSASVAIPWRGFKVEKNGSGNDQNKWERFISNDRSVEMLQNILYRPFPKGSATWPEEKLTFSTPLPTSFARGKSRGKCLRTSWQSNSHALGLVILTAGWDGRIRSFHNYGLPVT